MLKQFFLSFFILIAFHSFGQNESNYFFIENKGQWNEEVLYRADLPSGKMFLQKTGATYLFYDLTEIHERHLKPAKKNTSSRQENFSPSNVKMHAVKLQYLGSNPSPSLEKSLPTKDYYNYFIGNDQTKWAEKAQAFENILYKDLYQNIDLKFYTSLQQMKYDFIVAPHGNPEEIKIKYSGMDSIYLSNNNLYLKTSLNEVLEQKPYAYQIIKGDTISVECNFKLEQNTIAFDFPDYYDKKYSLIIDPILIFSTFSGSVSDNWGNTATPGENGTLYSGGIVFGPDFPVTTGAFFTTFSGHIDIALMKFDSSGSNLKYSTFLGGESAEIPYSLIINPSNELLILGTTSSKNFPITTNAFQSVLKGGPLTWPFDADYINYSNGSDFFITKIRPDGSGILSSTYFGGTNTDGIMKFGTPLVKNYGDQFRGDITTDESGNVYVASQTTSADFPVKDAFQPLPNGGDYDAVVFKLTPDLSTLLWSSYFGGSQSDGAFCIKLNKNNDVYIAGGTTSSNLEKTTGSLNPDFQGTQDGFVAKIKNTGNELLSTTYLGTFDYDQVYFIDLDSSQNVYAFGQTRGFYPSTSNVYYVPGGGQFIHKLDSDLSTTLFSTVFGTSSLPVNPNISPTAFMVSDCGNIYVSGWGGEINSYYSGTVGGNTFDLQVTPDAYQKVTDGSDFYLMVLSKNAEKLLFATFFGGVGPRGMEHVDGGTSRFDKSGIIYHNVCGGCATQGETQLSSYPTTPKAWSTTVNSDNCNMAAFKYDLSSIIALFNLNTNLVCNPPFVVDIENLSSGAVNYQWDFGDGEQSISPYVTSHSYDQEGTYTITLTAANTENCVSKTATHRETITVFGSHFAVGDGTALCRGEKFQLQASGGTNYSWSPSKGLDNPNSANPIAQPDTTTYYTVSITDEHGCTFQDSILVKVTKDVVIDMQPSYSFSCTEKPVFTFTNNSENATAYFWNFGDGSTSQEKSPTHIYDKDSIYEVTLVASNELCSQTKSFIIPVVRLYIPNVITPNDDHINDYFVIKSQEPMKLHIFNRWGKEVYISNVYKNNWKADGLPGGTYFYTVEDDKKNRCKGWFDVLK